MYLIIHDGFAPKVRSPPVRPPIITSFEESLFYNAFSGVKRILCRTSPLKLDTNRFSIYHIPRLGQRLARENMPAMSSRTTYVVVPVYIPYMYSLDLDLRVLGIPTHCL